ncbi:MAG TPA: hypothetical protein VK673_16020 [Chthoniobacterales bacterium]|nr:hypothetical protein [Chthoniobacterales bacterium]
MPSPVTPDPEKLDRFLEQGGEFFSWNEGKNTPNILLNLAERISELRSTKDDAGKNLRQTVDEASKSSSKLASALNWLTLIGAVIGGLSALSSSMDNI